MSISPVLLLFKSSMGTSFGSKTKALTEKAERKVFSSQLEEIFDSLIKELGKKALQSSNIKIVPVSMNIEQYKNRLTTNFAKVDIFLKDDTSISKEQKNKLIEHIEIYADRYNNKLRFTISPSWPAFSYNLKKDPHAKARTEALEAITRSLFEASNSDIAIATSDESLGCNSGAIEKPERFIPESQFILFKSGILPTLKSNLFEGNLPVNYAKDFGKFIEVAVTDQPFSLSSYNSDGTSPGMEYHRDILKILLEKAKKKSK